MVCVSLSTPEKAQQAVGSASRVQWLPTNPQWRNYVEALRHMGAAPRAEEMLISRDNLTAQPATAKSGRMYPPLYVGLVTGAVDPVGRVL